MSVLEKHAEQLVQIEDHFDSISVAAVEEQTIDGCSKPMLIFPIKFTTENEKSYHVHVYVVRYDCTKSDKDNVQCSSCVSSFYVYDIDEPKYRPSLGISVYQKGQECYTETDNSVEWCNICLWLLYTEMDTYNLSNGFPITEHARSLYSIPDYLYWLWNDAPGNLPRYCKSNELTWLRDDADARRERMRQRESSGILEDIELAEQDRQDEKRMLALESHSRELLEILTNDKE